MSTASFTLGQPEAFQWCKSLTRRRARNFYYGLKLLPEPRRSALYAIYAWMRQADDLIDDATDAATASSQLDQFVQNTSRALNGSLSSHEPMWLAMSEVARCWPLDPEPFSMMIEGQKADLHGHAIETPEDLLCYCKQVASSVGLICIDIWGHDDQAARDLAIDRGVAFQLTNVLRDLGEDLEAGRCYIPAIQLRESHVTRDDLASWRQVDRCEALVGGWIKIAKDAYDRSAPLDSMIDPDCRPTLWAMTSIYRKLLDRIEQQPRRIVTGPRVQLGPIQKTSIAIQARWMARS
ncbi:MAG: phytoene/squalene synthase family protein [Phycisphaerales bacterium]|nr:phytoene/squalene synthase family protein [Phycisphaerales bacterium]